MLYLDNAATTFPKPDSVYEVMDNVNRTCAVNSGRGSYKLARKSNSLIDETKKMLLKLANADLKSQVIFSPSVTVALNQILNGITFQPGDVVYVSPYEHNAIARTVHLIEKKFRIKVLEMPLDINTFEIDIDKLKYMFTKENPKCVCCTHVSNVTGYILPVQEIFEAAKKYNSITVLDAAQSLGLIPIKEDIQQADFIAFAGHKTLYGPFGIAGFIDSSNIKLNEFIVGGTGSDSLNLDMPDMSPNRYESASPNIVAIAGLNEALKCSNVDSVFDQEKKITDYLIDKLHHMERIIVYDNFSKKRHISIVSFNIEGFRAEDIGMILDEDYDIAVRTGYHCAPFIHKYLNDERYLGTVRVGIGRFTSKDDIDELINALNGIIEE